MRQSSNSQSKKPRQSAKSKARRKVRTEFCPWQYEAINATALHFALIGGVAVGKTFTGAHFAITQFIQRPELTGFIGANTYDQLSQATLRELMYWMERYEIEYVIDRIPPPHWGAPRKFKDYRNIISVRVGELVAHAFTRVLSDGDALRGLEFSWYWLDETRDTPQNTHDVVLSRLRESDYVRGLITTTPAGEDWSWARFVKSADGKLYGSVHVPTIKSVEFGIISRSFYDALLHSYSPNMAAQELEAKHVSALEGRCYYTAGEANRQRGLWQPDPELPLVVGMDFNFSPAPMAWVVGQIWIDQRGEERLHWFDELSGVEVSTREMARRLAHKYGDFFLRIYGDASGNRGTTSNAGVTDFNQISEELAQEGVAYTIDVDQCNPMVKDRVENVCRLLMDADGFMAMTYDPDRCPLLAADFDKVCWKAGKPSDGGDCQRTHAADGVGYACWKALPPMAGRAVIGKGIASRVASIGG